MYMVPGVPVGDVEVEGYRALKFTYKAELPDGLKGLLVTLLESSGGQYVADPPPPASADWTTIEIPVAKLKKASGRQYYGWKTKNFLLEDSLIDDSDIKEGLQVFFSGYPLNLGTEKFKNYPITRRGIVAQVIPGEKRFIMDGFASRGNSGSPVYCLIGDSIKLVGIQRSVYNDANVGYDEKGNINSLVSFNSGLSVVIKASVIRDFLYELIENGRYKGDWSD